MVIFVIKNIPIFFVKYPYHILFIYIIFNQEDQFHSVLLSILIYYLFSFIKLIHSLP